MSKELFHSDIYLGEDYSDGIKHYKYLKKVKTSTGKWRYIYDDSEEKKVEGQIKFLQKEYDKLSNKKTGTYSYRQADGSNVSWFKNGSKLTTWTTIYGNKQPKQTLLDQRKAAVDRGLRTLTAQHTKQKIKDIPKKIVAKGIAAVSGLFSKIFK